MNINFEDAPIMIPLLHDNLTLSFQEEYDKLKRDYDKLLIAKQEMRDKYNKELDLAADNLLKVNAALRGRDAELEALNGGFEREIERLNGINLEQEEKLQAAYTLLKLEL